MRDGGTVVHLRAGLTVTRRRQRPGIVFEGGEVVRPVGPRTFLESDSDLDLGALSSSPFGASNFFWLMGPEIAELKRFLREQFAGFPPVNEGRWNNHWPFQTRSGQTVTLDAMVRGERQELKVRLGGSTVSLDVQEIQLLRGWLDVQLPERMLVW